MLNGHSSISTLVNHLATATGMLPEQMRMQLRGSDDTVPWSDDFATLYPQPDTIDGYWRRIHASVGLYVSLRGDVAAAVGCRGAV